MSANEQPSLTELIGWLARALVDAPDEVEVEEIEEGDTHVIELTVAESDLGQIIGRQGRTAKALRAVLAVAAGKANKRASLEILE